jgi:hypothetical protein
MRLSLALGTVLLCTTEAVDPVRDMTPPPLPAPAKPHEKVLLSEDFSDTALGHWHSDRGAQVWSLRHGMLRADLPDGKQQRAFLYAGSEEWADYAVDLDVYAVRGVDKGVVVRIKGDSGVGVDLRGSGYEDLLLYRGPFRLGRSRVINANGQWHHLRVEAAGNRYRIFVDGVLVLDRRDGLSGHSHGRIALPAYTGGSGQCTVYYDNVVVMALK